MSEHVIATIPKNAREHIRIGLSEYKGHRLVFTRVWADKGAGNSVPTPKGLTVAIALLPAIIEAMQATLAHALKSGMLPGGSAE